jgi:hypothetical protein
MSRYNQNKAPVYNQNKVPVYDDGRYLGNLDRQELIKYQEEKKENTKKRGTKRASGGRIEYSKGTMPKRNKKNFRPTEKGAGMTRAGVAAYRRANPGSKLKTAVTGKVKPGSKAAKRRKSYCARSLGQLKRASAKTRNDPNSRIRQARRRWKC